MYTFIAGCVCGAVVATPTAVVWLKSEFKKLHDKLDAYEEARKASKLAH